MCMLEKAGIAAVWRWSREVIPPRNGCFQMPQATLGSVNLASHFQGLQCHSNTEQFWSTMAKWLHLRLILSSQRQRDTWTRLCHISLTISIYLEDFYTAFPQPSSLMERPVLYQDRLRCLHLEKCRTDLLKQVLSKEKFIALLVSFSEHNPLHIYPKVIPVESNEMHSQVSVYRIATSTPSPPISQHFSWFWSTTPKYLQNLKQLLQISKNTAQHILTY